LLRRLDDYLATLYEPQDNFILDEQALLAPEVSFLVAEQGGRVVGCGAIRRIATPDGTVPRPYGEVKRMMVEPQLRGQRIGARLLEALEALLRSERIDLALLETGARQTAAVRLYERCGYHRRAAFGSYPENGLSVFYEKSLAP
jgi:putative acetyltransferase